MPGREALVSEATNPARPAPRRSDGIQTNMVAFNPSHRWVYLPDIRCVAFFD